MASIQPKIVFSSLSVMLKWKDGDPARNEIKNDTDKSNKKIAL